ncbi:hypothetical protein [Sulfuricystis multivorans]|uniref:hypothetical protein n=1 Tax=Sulfuricystis multivorans TaxID=2211108 RepID=UPI000F82A982|nr:hypothetical protein [Sulfuricystis multivorans]
MRLFPEEGGVVYHCFSGELLAVDRVAAHLLQRLDAQPLDLATLSADTIEAFPELGLSSTAVRGIVDSLYKAGVVRCCPSENASMT